MVKISVSIISLRARFILEEFVVAAFASVDLDWRDHIVIDNSLLRLTDLAVGRGNAAKAKDKLGWQAKYKMQDVVQIMVKVRLAKSVQ